MKKIMVILFFCVFSMNFCKDYTNENGREIIYFFLTTKDFNYFKYEGTNCALKGKKRNEKKFDETDTTLHFLLDNKGLPIGEWSMSTKIGSSDIILIEECYENNKMIKQYNFMYNSIIQKRYLVNAIIYYPKKGIEYYVIYNLNDMSINYIYFIMNNKIYSFSIDGDGKLNISTPAFLDFPKKESMYNLYIKDHY